MLVTRGPDQNPIWEGVAGMTLWPTLITGLIGVAGIGGSILSARITTRSQTANLMLSISEEKERPGCGQTASLCQLHCKRE